MIKLIATDMDGTLLNSNGELPKDFFEILNGLLNKGVVFVAASGRQYHTLINNFGIAKDKIYFAAENGSFVVHKGKELFSKTIKREIILEIIEFVKEFGNHKVILCGKKYGYIEDTSTEFIEQVDKYYHKNKKVSGFEDVKDEFLKISLCDLNETPEEFAKVLKEKFGHLVNVVISGDIWIDIGRKDVNKGVALKFIQNKFGINHEETMVFGDYFNDIDMLKSAYHSYVMVNAPHGVKKHGRFIAGSNDENGVLEVIKKKVLKKEA